MEKLKFLELVAKLKHLPRTGWVNNNIPVPETVSGHMYRMAMCSFLLPNTFNIEKIMKMCLVHDLAESIVGDITPYDGVSSEDKYNQELSAITSISSLLPEWSQAEIMQLWTEYENISSPEAVIVKDLDKFDMILQAFEYEKAHKVDLSSFYEGTHKFRTDLIRSWAEEVYNKRKIYFTVNT